MSKIETTIVEFALLIPRPMRTDEIAERSERKLLKAWAEQLEARP